MTPTVQTINESSNTMYSQVYKIYIIDPCRVPKNEKNYYF